MTNPKNLPEVTPEMVEAGVRAYREYRPSETSEAYEEDVVKNVYLRMFLAASFTRTVKKISES